MFENEAVRGRLIGPKPWDRIDRNFKTKMLSPNREGCLGVSFHQICNKSCIDWNETGNGREMRVHKVNR